MAEKKRRSTEEKRLEQSKVRNIRNTAAKSAVKTAFKKAATAITDKEQSATELVRKAVKAIDSVSIKGIIHKNKAARKKSRLMKKLNKVSAA